jgi:diketogulonate reductase-like aldo/keto reductase
MKIIYGTAWKEERTQALVELALRAGFRGIDTANQRKHYCEAAVGDAIAVSGVKREELFLQTKFTYQRGQDHRLPFDPNVPLAEQVRQSMASSLQHLRTSCVDSYILHGPASDAGWTRDDEEVWTAMLGEQTAGRAKRLGVSNVALRHLVQMRERPAFVQNRCLARFGWDREVREFCRDNDIRYQGFWLLTGNVEAMQTRTVQEIAGRYGLAPTHVIFAFAVSAGILPLTGTASADHMRDDLAAVNISLSPEEVRAVETVFTP